MSKFWGFFGMVPKARVEIAELNLETAHRQVVRETHSRKVFQGKLKEAEGKLKVVEREHANVTAFLLKEIGELKR